MSIYFLVKCIHDALLLRDARDAAPRHRLMIDFPRARRLSGYCPVLSYDVGLVLRFVGRTGGARSRAAEGPTLGPDARGPSRRPQQRAVKRAAAGLDAQAAAVTEIA